MKIVICRTVPVNQFLACIEYLEQTTQADNYIAVVQRELELPEGSVDTEKWQTIFIESGQFHESNFVKDGQLKLEKGDRVVVPINNRNAVGYDKIFELFPSDVELMIWTLDRELKDISTIPMVI